MNVSGGCLIGAVRRRRTGGYRPDPDVEAVLPGANERTFDDGGQFALQFRF